MGESSENRETFSIIERAVNSNNEEDYVPISEIDSQKSLIRVMSTVGKYMDSVENFFQYIVRRLERAGIKLDYTVHRNNIPYGFVLCITVNVRSVHKNVLKSGKIRV